eukprot:TRINITY_DN2056_c0_g2_i1.p1 TRINITY_DN2056_c0_g2~~TRINITY_DN2056_c0_g2_i1.p1  ORF type:complete len:120 (+),score=7.72 TRINITY_DN2056_c0_g2_i1:243-602(+)
MGWYHASPSMGRSSIPHGHNHAPGETGVTAVTEEGRRNVEGMWWMGVGGTLHVCTEAQFDNNTCCLRSERLQITVRVCLYVHTHTLVHVRKGIGDQVARREEGRDGGVCVVSHTSTISQ